MMERLGIVIANTGSPESHDPEALKKYLSEFLSDRRICPMNPAIWKFILKACILPTRSKKSSMKYASIWQEEGSPLKVGMRKLASKFKDSFTDNDCNGYSERPCVLFAMSYGSPSVREALETLREQGCDKVVVIPMYPQAAFSTSYVVSDKVEQAISDMGWDVSLEIVFNYCDRYEYVEAIGESIKNKGFGKQDSDSLLFAFHSVPLCDVKNGDTYAEKTAASAKAIAEYLGLEDARWAIGYQCRFDKSRKWVSPYTTEVLPKLSGDGRLFVVAPNFSVDCLETLYDIDQELRDRWRIANPSKSADDFVYVSCLNDSDRHVRLLREIALSVIEGQTA